MKVFLSYSRRDGEFVHRLDRDLSALGYDVWLDTEDIAGSGEDRWRRSIVAGIRGTDVFLLVLSPSSTQSENVERELSVAADNDKRVIPVVLQPCELPDGFQYELAGVQHVDFSAVPYDTALSVLAAQIGAASGLQAGAAKAAAAGPAKAAAANRVGARPGARFGRWPRPAVLVAASLGVAALAVVVWLATADGGGKGQAATSASLVGSSASDAPATSMTPSPEQRQAEAIVNAWADATSRRDWDEVVRLNPEDPAAQGFEEYYGPATGPTTMVSIQPYVATAGGDGARWTLTGAIVAYDMVQGIEKTNFACRIWTVDLEAGTVTYGSFGAPRPRSAGWLPEALWPQEFATFCA